MCAFLSIKVDTGTDVIAAARDDEQYRETTVVPYQIQQNLAQQQKAPP